MLHLVYYDPPLSCRPIIFGPLTYRAWTAPAPVHLPSCRRKMRGLAHELSSFVKVGLQRGLKPDYVLLVSALSKQLPSAGSLLARYELSMTLNPICV